VCPRCHDLLIPSGNWVVTAEDGLWVTREADTDEVVCRRPVEGRASQALTVIQGVGDLLDVRAEKGRLLALFTHITDRDVLMLHEWAGRIGKGSARVQALARYEAWQRYPLKDTPDWAEKLGKAFGVAENTMRQDVQAARLFEVDTEPPMNWSWYRVLCHQANALELLPEVKETIWGQAGTVADLRKFLGLGKKDMHECPLCHGLHVVKEED